MSAKDDKALRAWAKKQKIKDDGLEKEAGRLRKKGQKFLHMAQAMSKLGGGMASKKQAGVVYKDAVKALKKSVKIQPVKKKK